MLYKDINSDGTLIIESYMYAPSLGRSFVSIYTDFRKGIIEKLLGYGYDIKSQDNRQFLKTINYLDSFLSSESSRNFLNQIFESDDNFIERLNKESLNEESLTQTSETITGFTGHIYTGDLIRNLINLKTSNIESAHGQVTDLLIRKFEVSKKLSDYYFISNEPAEITVLKGSDNNAPYQTYWMFSLLLLMNSVGADGIRILSTLLKINDSLCSIPIVRVTKEVNARQLAFSLAIETLIVNDVMTRISATHETR
jgi:hypothetical protein